MKKLLALIALVLTAGTLMFIVEAAPQQPSAARAGGLTIEQLIDIRHPSNAAWSPDGRHVAFLSERAGIANIFVADIAASSSTEARPLTRYADGQGGAFFWSADSSRVYFARSGDLWQVALSGGEPSAVWSTPQAENGISPSPDGTRVAFVRSATAPAPGAAPAAGGRGGRGGGGGGGDLMIRSLADGKETLVLRADNHVIGGLSWSPDGKAIVFSDNNRTIRHEQTPAYSGSKIIYTISENVPGETDVVNVDGTGMKTLGSGGGFGGRRWLDAGHFLAERTSPDFKKRTTSVIAIAGGEPKVLHEEVADKFWSITGDAGAQPSPDGKWIAFLSDRDGWDHVYVMPAAGGPAVQITKGKFEVRAPQWSPDSTRIAFDANEVDRYGDRHLYVATIGPDPARATIAAVTSGRGTDIGPQWSPDGTRLAFQHTDPHNSADIWTA